uniref:ARAD1A09350p n=1 Tax=Blastobotrys adeninivorans TaxID=409370 RepID=A0A060T2L3_BLAAD
MDDDDDFDDDIDLEELDRLIQQRNASKSQSVDAETPAPVAGSATRSGVPAERPLEDKLTVIKGENAILRSRLAQTQREYENEREQLLQSQNNFRQDQENEVQKLKDEIARLKNEQTFLYNEMQQVSFQRKLQRKSKSADDEEESLFVTTSPSPKRKRDFGASFRDGFGDASPSKRKRHTRSALDEDHTLVNTSSSDISTGNGKVQGDMNGNDGSDPVTAPRPWIPPVLSRAQYSLEFCRMITTHTVMGGQDRTLQRLNRFKFKDSTFMSELEQTLNSTVTGPELVRDFLDACSRLIQYTVYEREDIAPCPLLLDLVMWSMEYDPKSVLTPGGMSHWAQLIYKILKLRYRSIRDKEEGMFNDASMSIPVSTCRDYLVVLACLDVLHTLSYIALCDRDLSNSFWLDNRSAMRVLWLFLTAHVPSNALIKVLEILINCPAPPYAAVEEAVRLLTAPAPKQLSPMILFASLEGAEALFPIEYDTVESLASDSGEIRLARDPDDYEYDLCLTGERNSINVRRLIIKLLTFLAMGATHVKEGNSVVESSAFTGSVIQCMAQALANAYYEPGGTRQRLELVGDCVRYLKLVWELHSDPPSILPSLVAGASQDYMVSLARIAFSDPGKGQEELVRFDPSVMDIAQDLLEQCTTLSEGEDIYEAMTT